MPGNGKYNQLDLASVKTSAAKSKTFLRSKLPAVYNRGRLTVIFLGEMHNNAVDQEVTQYILNTLPVRVDGATRIIFERLLNTVYATPGAPAVTVRTEPMNLALNRKARSKLIADMAIDAFENHGVEVVYIVCGSAHAKEIFDAMDKRSGSAFAYIAKMSSTD